MSGILKTAIDHKIVMFRGSRRISSDVYWLLSCNSKPDLAARYSSDPPDWYEPGNHVHVSSSAYLITGEQSLLFDNLPPVERDPLIAELEMILGDDGLDYIVPSHHEAPHGGNTNALREAYPDAELLASGYGRGHEMYFLGDATRVYEGERLDLGGPVVEFVEAVILDTALHIWLFEHESRTLFSVDLLGIPHMGRDCLQTVDELEFEVTTAQLIRFHQQALPWLRIADPDRVHRALDEIVNRHAPSTIAPTHGLVIREDAIAYLEKMKEVVSEMATTPEAVTERELV